MGTVLLGAGAASFIGYLIWLIIRIRNWDSKIPPIIGMLLSLIMLAGGLSTVPAVQGFLEGGLEYIRARQEADASDSGGSSDGQGIWYVDYYKDEFQQPTGRWYITVPAFSGTFSDAISTDETLSVEFLADCDGELAFLLYKHGDSLQQTLYSFQDDLYMIVMRTSDGIEIEMSGTMHSSNSHLCIDGEYKAAVLERLRNGETLEFYIENTRYHIESYLFSIDTAGFYTVYQSQAGG